MKNLKTNYFRILCSKIETVIIKRKIYQNLNLVLNFPSRNFCNLTNLKLDINLIIPQKLSVEKNCYEIEPDKQIKNFSFSINNEKKKLIYYPEFNTKISDKYVEKTFEFGGFKLDLKFSESYNTIFEKLFKIIEKIVPVYDLILQNFQKISKILIKKNLKNNCYIISTIKDDIDKFFSFLEKYKEISKNISILSYHKQKESEPEIVFSYNILMQADNILENFKHYLIKQNFTKEFYTYSFSEFDLYTEGGSFYLNYNELKNNINDFKILIEFINTDFAKVITNRDLEKIKLILRKFSSHLNEINMFLKLLNL